MEVDSRTPDEMLDGAMKRILSIAEAVIKAFPRLKYVVGKTYRFSFDKTQSIHIQVHKMYLKESHSKVISSIYSKEMMVR